MTDQDLAVALGQVLVPDPQAIQEVVHAHNLYDPPGEPLILSMSLFDDTYGCDPWGTEYDQ